MPFPASAPGPAISVCQNLCARAKGLTTSAENCCNCSMLCLVQLYDEWVDFRLAELKALLAINGLAWDTVVRPNSAADNDASVEDRHFYILELPTEDVVRAICSRSVLVKAVYELWSCGRDLKSTIDGASALSRDFTGKYLDSEDTWAVNVNTFGRVLSMEQKQDCRLHFKFLDFKGPVKVTNPTIEMTITLDYTRFRHVTADTVIPAEEGGLIRQVRTDIPTYFGRLIARGGMKETLRVHDLKKRLYLGPTSLDDSLALILANISGVQLGMLAYDPFVGTASILVALTQLGCVCTGSDIDPRVLRGEMHAGTTSGDEAERKPSSSDNNNGHGAPTTETTEAEGGAAKKRVGVAEATAKRASKHNAAKRNIFANFRAYNLPLPELVRMDNHLFDRHLALVDRGSGYAGYFDVIVSDPPYGIRAGAKKTGRREPVAYSIPEERRHDHIPSTQRYPVNEVMLDLLHTAARSLVIGGVLTYLLPTPYDFSESDLPVHPCLQLTQVCHQALSSRHGRRAIVMRKYREYTPELQAEYDAYKEVVMLGEDKGFGLLMGKLEAALSADAFANDNVVKHMSVCSTKRKASKDRRREQREEGVFFPPKNADGTGGTLRPSKKALKQQQERQQQDREQAGEQAAGSMEG